MIEYAELFSFGFALGVFLAGSAWVCGWSIRAAKQGLNLASQD